MQHKTGREGKATGGLAAGNPARPRCHRFMMHNVFLSYGRGSTGRAVTPPAAPTSQLNEVRRGRNAANVAGGSFVFSRPALRDHGWFKAKTASRVDGLKRRVWAGKLQRCKGNRASRACFVGTPAAVPGRRTLRAFGCWRAIQRCEWFGRFHLAAVRAGLGRYARALERACRWRSTARRHARARFW